jgi:N-acetyl-gamma-glutamyl-phosphate reductase
MSKTKVFIDGSSGTAGLRIRERLEARDDIEIISIPYELRHDLEAKSQAINSADVAFLCLPDEGSVDAIEHGVKKVIILDGRVPHATLIEILTDEGAGTMVYGGNKDD